ncbi:MAG: acylphosphatase [Candidatus Kapabacteria bacterium]|nr:acylphosphatase [Candidatus Kapabacteria bacterium]
MIKVKYHIDGLVQGVGFRYFIYQNAVQLGLKGFAKNNYDGSVSATIEGAVEIVEKFESLIKLGPSRSQVRSFKRVEQSFSGEFTRFEIY